MADKLAYGLLDAAVVPPLALTLELGLRPAGARLAVPMSLSLNGNSVVLAEALAAPILYGGIRPPALEAGRRLRRLVDGGLRPRIALVHAFSTHDLLLRYWLAASGIDTERAVELSVVLPPEMPAALAAGRIRRLLRRCPLGRRGGSNGRGARGGAVLGDLAQPSGEDPEP